MPETTRSTESRPAALSELVDRFLGLYDVLNRTGLARSYRRAQEPEYKAIEAEILDLVGSVALTRNGRCLVPMMTESSSFRALKVLRYRDLDVEDFCDHEARVLEACRRSLGAGPAARPEDLAVIAGEIRRMADCSEREALEAARDLARLEDLEAPEDLTALATMAHGLLDRSWPGRPIVDGPPFDSSIFLFTDEEVRSMISGPGRD